MEKVSFGQKTKVLVVGAGPIGLAAALEFANFEIETLVVDELSEINRASKAICWSQSRQLNSRIILLMANQIADNRKLTELITLARTSLDVAWLGFLYTIAN
ncbi:MAG: hypothetical protein CMM15_07970 [Rhodospirillaceae bacterium]|nr:hypothetical protein [Rhodospirillaceae bacterium]|tara:strand:+ start:837 stop:1142 length:306 start_codon:yes stop_codon:yes gene_type:complete